MELKDEKRPIRRNAEIRVKVDPEMEEALSTIAKARGLPPATLAAVVIGEYVEAFRTRRELQRETLMSMIASPSLAESMERVMAQTAAAMMTPENLALMSSQVDEASGGSAVVAQGKGS